MLTKQILFSLVGGKIAIPFETYEIYFPILPDLFVRVESDYDWQHRRLATVSWTDRSGCVRGDKSPGRMEHREKRRVENENPWSRVVFTDSC